MRQASTLTLLLLFIHHAPYSANCSSFQSSMASLRTGVLARRIVGTPAASRTLLSSTLSSAGCTTPMQCTTSMQRRFAHEQPQSKVPLTKDPAKESKPPPYEKRENVGDKRFSQFDLSGKVFVVAGGGRGLGLSMAEGLVEAGGRGKLVRTTPLNSR